MPQSLAPSLLRPAPVPADEAPVAATLREIVSRLPGPNAPRLDPRAATALVAAALGPDTSEAVLALLLGDDLRALATAYGTWHPEADSPQGRAAARGHLCVLRVALAARVVAALQAQPAALWSPLLVSPCRAARGGAFDDFATVRLPWVSGSSVGAEGADTEALESGTGAVPAPVVQDPSSAPWGFLRPLVERAARTVVGDPAVLDELVRAAAAEPSGALEALVARVHAPWTPAAIARLLGGVDGSGHCYPGLATLQGLVQNPSVDDTAWGVAERRTVQELFGAPDPEPEQSAPLLAVLQWTARHGRVRAPAVQEELLDHLIASDLRHPARRTRDLLEHPEVREHPRVCAHVAAIRRVVHPVVRLAVEPEGWLSAWQALAEQGAGHDRRAWPLLGARHAAQLTPEQWAQLLTGAIPTPGVARGEWSGVFRHLTPAMVAAWPRAQRAELLAGAPRPMRLQLLRLLGAGPAVHAPAAEAASPGAAPPRAPSRGVR